MFYAIEKQGAEWVVLAHGVAIMRCADGNMALEIVQIAQEQLRRLDAPESQNDHESHSDLQVPSVHAPSVAPHQAANTLTLQPLQPAQQHHITAGQKKSAKLP